VHVKPSMTFAMVHVNEIGRIHGKSGKLADKARKTLHTIFYDLGLKITAEVNNHIVNFLDVALNCKKRHSPDTENRTTIPSMLTVVQIIHLLS
jgi:hypothetical protein